jgi:hypothetical protein
MRIKVTLSAVVLLAGIVGCTQTHEPAPPDTHPASPSATEAPTPKLSATLNPDDVAPSAPVAYSCPHHPQVMQAEPGECPRCGMKLEPTASRQTSPVRTAPAEKTGQEGLEEHAK